MSWEQATIGHQGARIPPPPLERDNSYSGPTRAGSNSTTSNPEFQPTQNSGVPSSSRDFRDGLCTGSLVDCQDLSDGKWYTAVVAQEVNDQVQLQYEGFGPEWAEWIKKDSARIAKRGSMAVPTVPPPNAQSPGLTQQNPPLEVMLDLDATPIFDDSKQTYPYDESTTTRVASPSGRYEKQILRRSYSSPDGFSPTGTTPGRTRSRSRKQIETPKRSLSRRARLQSGLRGRQQVRTDGIGGVPVAYSLTKERAENGARLYSKMGHFFEKLAKMEESYAAELMNLSAHYRVKLTELQSNQFSLFDGITEVLSSVYGSGVVHKEAAGKIHGISRCMEAFSESSNNDHISTFQRETSYSDNVKNNLVRLEKERTKVEKRLNQLQQRKEEFENAEEREQVRVSNLNQKKSGPKFLRTKGTKAQQHIEELRTRALKKHQDCYDESISYIESVGQFNQLLAEYHEKQIPETIRGIQSIDKVRNKRLKEDMTQFNATQEEVQQNSKKVLKSCQNVLNTIDEDEDTIKFNNKCVEFHSMIEPPQLCYNISKSVDEIEDMKDELAKDGSNREFIDMIKGNNKTLMAYFEKFLEESLCHENILFYRATNKYEQCADLGERQSMARDIYQEFLAEDAPYMLNISADDQQHIGNKLHTGELLLFKNARSDVYKLMKSDSYRNFIKSEMYKEYQRLVAQ